MSPRAAWRLERLGYGPVYDYAAGKVDWVAAGLPTIRADTSERRALDGADRDPPTCGPDDVVGDVAAANRDVTLIVVNDSRVVLGRFRARQVSGEGAIRVEDAMEPGPTTVRAHEPLGPLLERMAGRNVDEVPVTTPDGVLLGVVRRPEEKGMTEPALDLFDDADLDGPVAAAVRRLAVVGFHSLWRGESPTLAELGAPDTDVFAQAADHLRVRGRIEVDEEGRLVGIHGLARRATRHRIQYDGGAVNTWCALDAIGIPAALGIDARAVTQCPTCRRDLSVIIERGEPLPPPEVLLWYPPDQCPHLIDDFCSGANLFCSADHLRRWVGDDLTAGRVMTVQEVAEFGRATWAEVADGA